MPAPVSRPAPNNTVLLNLLRARTTQLEIERKALILEIDEMRRHLGILEKNAEARLVASELAARVAALEKEL